MPSSAARTTSACVWPRSRPSKAPRMCGLASSDEPPARLGLNSSRLAPTGDWAASSVITSYGSRPSRPGLRGQVRAQVVPDPLERGPAGEHAHGRGEHAGDHVGEDVRLRALVQQRLAGGHGDPERRAERGVDPALGDVPSAQGHARVVHAAAGHLQLPRQAQLPRPPRRVSSPRISVDGTIGGSNVARQVGRGQQLVGVVPAEQIVDAAAGGVGVVGRDPAGEPEVDVVLGADDLVDAAEHLRLVVAVPHDLEHRVVRCREAVARPAVPRRPDRSARRTAAA